MGCYTNYCDVQSYRELKKLKLLSKELHEAVAFRFNSPPEKGDVVKTPDEVFLEGIGKVNLKGLEERYLIKADAPEFKSLTALRRSVRQAAKKGIITEQEEKFMFGAVPKDLMAASKIIDIMIKMKLVRRLGDS